jgi:septum formation topological specificity factor MinE
VNKIKTATNETARKAIDYFPDLRDDILANLKDLLKIEQANRQTDAINNLHGLIVQNINTRINSLKDTLATLVANAKTSPMKIFETGTRLIKAYALKLEELEYRYLTPAHPVGFNDRPRLVRLAEAHALQETKRIYEKQIVLVKELKNELEKMSAPQGNIATVVGYHANLETEKAKISTSLKDKLGDLGADFPRVKDWEKTLDNIFDENQVHLSYFEDTLHPSQRFSMTYQMLAPALTANAEGWLSTLSNAEIAAFRSNPIETLPKLTPAQRNALRALDDASVTSLGLKKVNLSTQLFGGANPNADQLTELQRIMLPA